MSYAPARVPTRHPPRQILIEVFLRRSTPAGRPGFQLCGTAVHGGAFANGKNIAAVERYRGKPLTAPAADKIVRVEDMGTLGQAMIHTLQEHINGTENTSTTQG